MADILTDLRKQAVMRRLRGTPSKGDRVVYLGTAAESSASTSSLLRREYGHIQGTIIATDDFDVRFRLDTDPYRGTAGKLDYIPEDRLRGDGVSLEHRPSQRWVAWHQLRQTWRVLEADEIQRLSDS